jgi:hypothetical protein
VRSAQFAPADRPSSPLCRTGTHDVLRRIRLLVRPETVRCRHPPELRG